MSRASKESYSSSANDRSNRRRSKESSSGSEGGSQHTRRLSASHALAVGGAPAAAPRNQGASYEAGAAKGEGGMESGDNSLYPYGDETAGDSSCDSPIERCKRLGVRRDTLAHVTRRSHNNVLRVHADEKIDMLSRTAQLIPRPSKGELAQPADPLDVLKTLNCQRDEMGLPRVEREKLPRLLARRDSRMPCPRSGA